MAQRNSYNQLSSYATTIARDNNDCMMRVTYHHTVITSFNDEVIILDSGGYFTATTKRKMNQASKQFKLGYRIYAQDSIWYVTYNGVTIPFKSGMILRRI